MSEKTKFAVMYRLTLYVREIIESPSLDHAYSAVQRRKARDILSDASRNRNDSRVISETIAMDKEITGVMALDEIERQREKLCNGQT